MKKKLAIFRKFRHDELKKIGVKDGYADASFLSEVAKNTNDLIKRKLHAPPVHPSHHPESEAALGWNTNLDADSETLFSDIEFTDEGAKKAGKEYRFFSASFGRDFPITGETGSTVLPGPYLRHVALLGNTPPRVKGLVDLADSQFAADETPHTGHIYFSVNQSSGELCFFAEINESPTDGNPTATKKATTEGTMTVEELKEQIEKQKADFAESEKKRKEAEAQLAEVKKKEAKASFADKLRKVGELVKGAQTRLAIGKDDAEKLKAFGARLVLQSEATADFSESDREAMFATAGFKYDAGKDLLAMFGEIVDGLKKPIVPTAAFAEDETKGEGDQPAPESGLTYADFAEAQADVAAGRKVSAAFQKAKAKDPKLTMDAFQRQHRPVTH